MIILDTNVLSELMKDSPSPSVLKYLNKENEFYTTSITISEISFGIEVLPNGKRKKNLKNAFNKMIDEILMDLILPFDEESARYYGSLSSNAKNSGINIEQNDILIASIVKQHNGTIWTRNTKDFIPLKISVFDPFKETL